MKLTFKAMANMGIRQRLAYQWRQISALEGGRYRALAGLSSIKCRNLLGAKVSKMVEIRKVI